MASRKKSGAPDPKYFELADTIGKFDPVRQWLIKNCKKVSFKITILVRFYDEVTTVIVLINAHSCSTPRQSRRTTRTWQR